MASTDFNTAPRYVRAEGALTRLAQGVAGFLRMFDAAVRVAAATEFRRQADPADLEVLGIRQKLPRRL